MVAFKKAIESFYDGKCTIVEHKKIQNSNNKRTEFQDIVVQTDLPCRLSFKTSNNTNQTDTAAEVQQITKVFLSNDIEVAAGSKLVVSQNNVTTEYKSSGKPLVYSTHQEVVVELFNGWA